VPGELALGSELLGDVSEEGVSVSALGCEVVDLGADAACRWRVAFGLGVTAELGGVGDEAGDVALATLAAVWARRLASANGISVPASVRACALLASELLGPGPIATPASTPSASIPAARLAISLRERAIGFGGLGGCMQEWSCSASHPKRCIPHKIHNLDPGY
jgi:hypothetical protein